ncbi:hypothetical protein D3C72_1318860 [compost metagenome]
MQHLEGIARAVAHRHDDVVGFQVLAIRQLQAAHLAAVDVDIVDARFEADLAAQLDDLGAHLLDHADQAEGADMRACLVQDVFRRAGAHELVEHLAAIVLGVLDLAVQLAVRERARAAFAKLHVRLGVEHALAPQAEGVPGALAHFLAALQDDRAEARLRQDQAGQQAARAHADHHRARMRAARLRARDEVVRHVGRHAPVRLAGHAFDCRGLVADLDIDDVGELDIRALARIVGTAEHGIADQGVSLDADLRGAGAHGGVQVAFGMVEREFDFT